MTELTTWMANILAMGRIIGIGVVGVGIVVVGIRFVFASVIGSEHQNVIAKSGIIVLIVGAVIILGSTGFLTLLYDIAGVQQ